MAKMKIRFGKDFKDSFVKIDGKEISARNASLRVEAGGFGDVEIEHIVDDPKGHYYENIRRHLEHPIEVEVEIPDSIKDRMQFRT